MSVKPYTTTVDIAGEGRGILIYDALLHSNKRTKPRACLPRDHSVCGQLVEGEGSKHNTAVTALVETTFSLYILNYN